MLCQYPRCLTFLIHHIQILEIELNQNDNVLHELHCTANQLMATWGAYLFKRYHKFTTRRHAEWFRTLGYLPLVTCSRALKISFLHLISDLLCFLMFNTCVPSLKKIQTLKSKQKCSERFNYLYRYEGTAIPCDLSNKSIHWAICFF